MQELRATVLDEEFAELEHLAQVLGVPLEELAAAPCRGLSNAGQSGTHL